MTETNYCAFCDDQETDWRTVRKGEYSRSFVSNPRFREGQTLVIPNRHIETVTELLPAEGSEIMAELGRLAYKLDRGYGSGIMQKYQPLQGENGIKVNHLHFHVFPRVQSEDGLFPVPEPNAFEGFERIDRADVAQLAESLR